MVKIILICERCKAEEEIEYSISFTGKIVLSLNSEDRHSVFTLEGSKDVLLCPSCIEKVCKVMDEANRDKDQRIRSFLKL